jgi:2-polyprenyl-3-methyl-5-hydroxy-6-metoxy-1,4-benzoquinol methylase
MNSPVAQEAQILSSWHSNAAPWTQAVRDHAIESRRLVTDQAILEAVRTRSPRTVLDVGCGEGWLARALAREGLDVLGIDVVPQLIEAAQRAGGARFRVGSYETLIADAQQAALSRFDAVICNFALFGEQSVASLLRCVPWLLTPTGALIVQTLHPLMACGEAAYRDGWRAGSWQGFSRHFRDPPPWYFRTLQSWVHLHTVSGLRLLEMREPLHPVTERPASVIFISCLNVA